MAALLLLVDPLRTKGLTGTVDVSAAILPQLEVITLRKGASPLAAATPRSLILSTGWLDPLSITAGNL